MQSPLAFRSHLHSASARLCFPSTHSLVRIMSDARPVFRGAGFMPRVPAQTAAKAPPPPPPPPPPAEPASPAPKALDKAALKRAASEKVNEGGPADFEKWAANEAETIKVIMKGSAAASSSAPNAQAEDNKELAKKQFKRQRQRAKQDLTKELRRDPTDQEIAAFMKTTEEARAQAPSLKGPAQPKPVMHEMAYTGMPVAKALPKPNDARKGNPEPDAFRAGEP